MKSNLEGYASLGFDCNSRVKYITQPRYQRGEMEMAWDLSWLIVT